MTGRTKLLMHQYRPLMIILVITMVIWTAWAMSENQNYSTKVRVEVVGVDTARYAIVSRDSVIELDITSNGYRAIQRYFELNRKPVVVDMSNGRRGETRATIGIHAVISEVRSQFDIPNNIPITSNLDSLRVYYSARIQKGFVPVFKNVDFSFADGYGLSGQPYLLEDSIFLYGSSESLSHVSELTTLATQVNGVKDNDTLQISLFPVWEKYPDLRVSQPYISLVVPVGAYYDGQFEVDVLPMDADTSRHIRIYPDKVKLLVQSPTGGVESISEEQFHCRIDVDHDTDKAKVLVTRFPSQVRIKKVEPEYVQYVVIK